MVGIISVVKILFARTHTHELSEIYWASATEDIKILPQTVAKDFSEGKILSDQTRCINGGSER